MVMLQAVGNVKFSTIYGTWSPPLVLILKQIDPIHTFLHNFLLKIHLKINFTPVPSTHDQFSLQIFQL
jgi:hypothetical protein